MLHSSTLGSICVYCTCVSYSDDIPAQLGKQLHRYVVMILMISVNIMVTRWYHKFDVFTARFHVSIMLCSNAHEGLYYTILVRFLVRRSRYDLK